MENPRRQEERDFEIAVQESQEAISAVKTGWGPPMIQLKSKGWVDHGGRCRWPGNALADL